MMNAPGGPRCAKELSPRQKPRCEIDALEPRRLLSGSAISFAPPQLYLHAAAMVATADLNHDGFPDVVTVSANRDLMEVFLNRGDGTLSLPPVSYVVNNPRWVAIADFNGDGNPDLAVASSNNTSSNRNELDIYYGAGNGTFSKPVRSFTGRPAKEINVADLNGDGLPDVILTNHQRVSVMMNLGNETFAPPAFYQAGPNVARSVTVGDFNNDGALDLAVVRSDRRLEMLMGQKDSSGHPTGTFGPPVLVARVGVEPAYAVAGDFNGDGKLDLAVANSEFRVAPVSVLLGNGDGTFQPKRSLFGGNFVDALTTADFNGDGIADLATTSFTSGLRIYRGNGDGTFGPLIDYEGARFGIFATTADMNGDGRPDLVIANGPVFRVILNNTTTSPPPITPPGTLDVALSAGHPIRFTNSHGFLTTLSLNGPGSAAVELTGQSPAQTGNRITGDDLSIANIALSATTTASTLVIATSGKSGVADVGSISDDASIGSIKAPTVLLHGNLTIAGSAGNIVLDSATDNTISIGAANPRGTSIHITRADGASLQSAAAIATLDAGQWISSDGTTAAISAPSIQSIRSAGPFAADLNLGAGGLGNFSAAQISGGAWNIAGACANITVTHNATFSVNAASLGTISTGGALLNSVIRSAGQIRSVSTAGLLSSDVYAGVGTLAAGQILPGATSDFTAAATIGSVTVRSTHQGASFANSAIAASAINRATLGTIEMSNSGVPFGIAAHQIGFISGQDALTRKSFALAHPATSDSLPSLLVSRGISPADFAARIL